MVKGEVRRQFLSLLNFDGKVYLHLNRLRHLRRVVAIWWLSLDCEMIFLFKRILIYEWNVEWNDVWLILLKWHPFIYLIEGNWSDNHQGAVSLRLMMSQFKDIMNYTQNKKTVECIFCGVWVQNFAWNFKALFKSRTKFWTHTPQNMQFARW